MTYVSERRERRREEGHGEVTGHDAAEEISPETKLN